MHNGLILLGSLTIRVCLPELLVRGGFFVYFFDDLSPSFLVFSIQIDGRKSKSKIGFDGLESVVVRV